MSTEPLTTRRTTGERLFKLLVIFPIWQPRSSEVTLQEWRDKAVPDIPLYYWSRRVGGSTTGVILRSGAGLLRRMISGEEWILVVSPELDAFFSPTKPYWGAAATIGDCFDAEIVDDGVCSVTEFVLEDVKYYYWLARFGGNAAGHVIRGCAPPATAGDILNSRAIFSSLLGGPWVAVAQNVDDDLTWTCPTNPAPEGFMDRLREVVERG